MRFFAAVLLSCTCLIAMGQTENKAIAGNPNGLSWSGWKIDFGFSRDYQSVKNLSYYKISFEGETVYENGNMLTMTTIGGAWNRPKVESDTDEFRLDIFDGVSSLSSPVYQAYGIRPLEFTSSLGGLRGALQVSGRLIGEQELNIGVGLETKPLNLNIGDMGITNNIRLGIFGMKHSEEGDQDKDFFTVSYRAYIGKGLGYVSSVNKKKLIDELVERALKLTPEEKAALEGMDGDSTDPLVLVAWIIRERDEAYPETGAVWRAEFERFFSKSKDQPSFTIEFMAEGTYAPASFVRRRYNSLWGASINWWPNPENPDSSKIFLSYQNGFSRGDTENPLTGFVVGFGIKF